MPNLLRSERVLFLAVIIVLVAVIGVIGYNWNKDNKIVSVPRDKEIVLVEEEFVEIVENCAVQLGPCNLIKRPMEKFLAE